MKVSIFHFIIILTDYSFLNSNIAECFFVLSLEFLISVTVLVYQARQVAVF